MLDKPVGCLGCPLHTKGKGFCPDKVPANPRWAIVGEAPGKNEIAKAEPFIGQAGYVLDNWLLKAVPALVIAQKRGEVIYMNTLRCLPPEVQGRAYPKGEERRLAEAHCRQYDPDLTAVHTVALFGDSPQRCFFGTEL